MLSFLSSSELAQLDRLELTTADLVNGISSGGHRSNMKGGASEFSEHRSYSPGDEIRHLDWRVLAKTNRHYIKEYDEETTAQGMLILDTSGSMNFAGETMSKFDYAKAACACSARLILQQRDPVGLCLGSGDLKQTVPPRSSARHLERLLSEIYHTHASDQPSVLASLRLLLQQLKRRTRLFLFSDGLFDSETFHKAAHMVNKGGHELVFFHILAPEELSFQFTEETLFVSLEDDRISCKVDAAAIAETYIERIQAHIQKLRHACHTHRCSYFPMVTNTPVVSALSHFLNQAPRKRSRASTLTSAHQ